MTCWPISERGFVIWVRPSAAIEIRTRGPVSTAELSGIGASASDVELGLDGVQAEIAKVKAAPETL